MGSIQKRRRAAQARPPSKESGLEQAVRRQLAWAAGTESFQNRDPLYHVTESFQQTFDAMGQKHAREAAGEQRSREPRPEGPGRRTAPGNGDRADPASARSFYEEPEARDQDMVRRFSETAFQRGALSGAVLQGTGRMMLFSCLKKTVGQSQPVKEQQRKLFGTASQLRNIPGAGTGQVMFNRGFTDSAVGLVVDTLRDARRAVADLQDLLQGGLSETEAGSYGADTLRRMYPFLDDSRERELLTQYCAQLDGLETSDSGEKGVLQNAISRTRALINKKTQMKTEFINKLRLIADRATEALTEFEEPGFAAALDTALREAVGAQPPDGGEGGADSGAADQGQGGPADGADPSPGGTGQDAGADAAE